MITENNNKQCPVCGDIMTTEHSNYVPVWSNLHDNIVCIDCKETTEMERD
jgi:RNA polymerase subunit RPABC4/transcription elongation factor Spt4